MNFKNDTTDRATVQLEILAPIKEVAIIPTSHCALTSASCNTSPLINSETSGFKLSAFTWRRLHGGPWNAYTRSLACGLGKWLRPPQVCHQRRFLKLSFTWETSTKQWQMLGKKNLGRTLILLRYTKVHILLKKMPYRIYSINRPGRLLKFWTLRVGAYSRLGAY